MYGTRDNLAYLGYGAIRLFQDEILRGQGNFWSQKKKYRSRIAINMSLSQVISTEISLESNNIQHTNFPTLPASLHRCVPPAISVNVLHTVLQMKRYLCGSPTSKYFSDSDSSPTRFIVPSPILRIFD